jgi:hypothetical protein
VSKGQIWLWWVPEASHRRESSCSEASPGESYAMRPPRSSWHGDQGSTVEQIMNAAVGYEETAMQARILVPVREKKH